MPPQILGNSLLTAAASTRLQQLVGILQSFGVADLSESGRLDFTPNPTDTLLPTAGVTLAGANPLGQVATFGSARNYSIAHGGWQAVGGNGCLVASSSTPSVVVHGRPTITLPPGLAFWAACEIILPAGTLVVIQPPTSRLVLMAERMTVGDSVTITWARPPRQVAAPGTNGTISATGATGSGPATGGATGESGGAGGNGAPGWLGASAPSLEIWVLDVSQTIWVDLAGQNGGQGGPGGKGGQGGRGGDGSPEQYGLLGFCAAGVGSGGPGGLGGQGGEGGPGGPGGAGGDLQLFAPDSEILTFLQSAVIELAPGEGGPGGERGAGEIRAPADRRVLDRRTVRRGAAASFTTELPVP